MNRASALRSQPGPSTGFEALLGLELTELSDGLARGRVAARPELTRPDGVIHEGVLAAVAHSLTLAATAAGLHAEAGRCTALSNQTTFFRPVSGGEVRAVARRRHGGRSSWVWEVEMSDHRDELCAICRVTIAISG